MEGAEDSRLAVYLVGLLLTCQSSITSFSMLLPAVNVLLYVLGLMIQPLVKLRKPKPGIIPTTSHKGPGAG
jgi:hypothetical protein